jgi:hypothetical protein
MVECQPRTHCLVSPSILALNRPPAYLQGFGLSVEMHVRDFGLSLHRYDKASLP